MEVKVAIGCDHGGFKLKQTIKETLHIIKIDGILNIEINDFGCYSDESCDYPDFGHKVSKEVNDGNVKFGILICGSGNGINMSANKWPGVRSALCWSEEIAELARLHNDANILTLPGRFISEEEAKKCVKTFLETRFEGGRHIKRIEKIPLNF